MGDLVEETMLGVRQRLSNWGFVEADLFERVWDQQDQSDEHSLLGARVYTRLMKRPKGILMRLELGYIGFQREDPTGSIDLDEHYFSTWYYLRHQFNRQTLEASVLWRQQMQGGETGWLPQAFLPRDENGGLLDGNNTTSLTLGYGRHLANQDFLQLKLNLVNPEQDDTPGYVWDRYSVANRGRVVQLSLGYVFN